MRTNAAVRLRPRSDLQPFLEFLNRAVLSERGPTEQQMDKVVEELGMPRRSFEHRVAVETAVWRFGKVTRVREKRNLGFAIVKEFVRPMEARGFDYTRSMTAWKELWWFLTSEHPELHGRLGQCDWCERFFYRYTRKTKSCSPLCRLAPSLVRHPDQRLAARVRKILLAFAKEAEQKPSTPTLSRVSDTVIPHFLDVINRKNRRPFVFPKNVSDPAAFIEVWEFLFRDVDTLCGRMRRCEACQGLFYAYHQANRACGRECQMRRYHQRPRTRRKRGTAVSRSIRRR